MENTQYLHMIICQHYYSSLKNQQNELWRCGKNNWRIDVEIWKWNKIMVLVLMIFQTLISMNKFISFYSFSIQTLLFHLLDFVVENHFLNTWIYFKSILSETSLKTNSPIIETLCFRDLLINCNRSWLFEHTVILCDDVTI